MVGKHDFAAQADQVFRNLGIALQASGCTAANLVKLTVFLTDMENLGRYREARNRFFATVTPPAAPAVTLVEVSKLYGPDFKIEIEAIAAVWRTFEPFPFRWNRNGALSLILTRFLRANRYPLRSKTL